MKIRRSRFLPSTLARPEQGLALRILSCIILVTAILAGTAAQAAPADDRCLACHSMAALSKTLGDGTKLSLHVAKQEWSESVHSMMGCAMCHRDVDPAKHPSMAAIASERDYAIEKSAVCRTCHASQFEQYDSSVHASLVKAGDAQAPVCTSCHDIHTQKKVATYDAASGEPCKTCHEDIFDAYAGSMHGKARIGAGEIKAPICIDCHQAHDVKAVTSGDQIKTACLGCHEGALLAHDKWLPNSALHLEMVSCPACHSPMADRSVDLRMHDKESGEPVTDSGSESGFEETMRAIDTEGDGLDSMELREAVRGAAGNGSSAITLKGRLEVSSGVQAHQLAVKIDAVRDCDTCHQSGANPYENVTVSVSSEDGRRIKYEADDETLTSAVSVDAVGGFYTAGGTRIKILDILVVLAIFAGLAIPVTHMAIRKYFKNKN